MNEYKQMIEEKDYCDQSELLISEYSNMQTLDFQQQLQFMNKWARDDTQHTLLITGAEESGKKTLLCSFLRENKIAHPDWLHIANFATITPIYSNILYKIMVQLRNHYKIQQKVDLNEQKLRRYFKYWLEVTSQFLEKQYLGYNRREVPKVVIILQGIDLCVDSKGNTVEQQFWLPSKIPVNIKFIITTKNSSTIPLIDCQILRHHLSKQRKDKIIKRCSTTVQSLSHRVTDLSLYHLHIVDQMLKIRPQITFQGLNFIKILEQYMIAVAQPGLSEQEIRSLLYTLTLTRKGLKLRWVKRIINITTDKWQLFCKLFSFLIVQSSGYYIICNRGAKTAITQIVDQSRQKVKTYRLSIINSIKNEPLRLRGLEEIVYQLLLSENYSQLKEVISRIQNFIMLYTPFSKQLLCQCWVRLEQLEQFDPVFQYNKAIEAYASHYYPKEEQLYKIIFQVSMFFKEYAEFQNAKTPKFRHPLIKGESDQFEEIGIYEQLKSLVMIGKCKTYKLKPLQKNISVKQPAENREKILKKSILDKTELSKAIQQAIQKKGKTPIKVEKSEKVKTNYEKSAIETREIISTDDCDINQRPLTSELKSQQNQSGSVIFNIEELNVGIISNQQKFRQFFTDEMKEYLQNYFAPLKKNIYKEKELTFETQQSDNQQQSCKQKQQRQFKIDIEKLKESFVLKKYKEYLQQNYHKTGEEVSYYYYKQWIWLQFPWLCQTVKHVYSQMMTQCLPGSIRFMSPLKEFTLIKQVIKIARNAKESKSGIYTEKKIQILPIKQSNIKYAELSKSNQSQKLDQSICHTKRTLKQPEKQKKFKINLYRIQELIVKQKQLQVKLKEKGDKMMMRQLRGVTSLPNLNLFVTETNHKQSSNLFPALNKSKFAVESRRRGGQKENNADTRNYTVIIRKYNELKHQNQMLVQKIEQMKILENKFIDKSRQHINNINSNIEELQVKRVNLQKSYKNQQDLRKKLEVIIKVCDLNKMYGSQTDYLSTYLNSLKEMINIEDGKTSEIKERIFYNIEETRKNIKLMKQKRKQLKTRREQNLPYINIGTDSTNPPYGIVDEHCIEKDIMELSRYIKNKPKKLKTKERHFLSSQDYQILEEQIGIKFQDPNNLMKIQDFVDKVEKLKTLKLKNSDLNAQCAVKTKENTEIKTFLKSLIEGVEGEKQIHIASLLVQKRKELYEFKKRNKLLSNALKSITDHYNE